VHPSRWEAGVPFSVLEAMLAAKPLLITDRADPTGLIAGSGAGVVTTPDEDGIRMALSTLIDADSDELGRFAGASRALVEQHFRWERTVQILLDAYREAIDEPALA
jgi:glycosyltransferase involved in cell wall biosynthesis